MSLLETLSAFFSRPTAETADEAPDGPAPTAGAGMNTMARSVRSPATARST